MNAEQALQALRDLTLDGSIRLMHTLSTDQTLEQLLEQAKGEKNLQRIRMYLRLLEEYSTYMTKANKRKTLVLLYELLMHPDGDVRRIAGRHYGFILANINRNILTADMPAYAAALEPGGDLVMSGFLEQDVPAIVACAGELGLRPVATAARDGWMMVHVRKG